MAKMTNGRILIALGVGHILFGVSPLAFGNSFQVFASSGFFRVTAGLKDFPILNGTMPYEHYAAFWFFYFGLLALPLGVLAHEVERRQGILPVSFITTYFVIVLVGVYMVPFSGMTIFMLPHAIYMWISQRKLRNRAGSDTV